MADKVLDILDSLGSTPEEVAFFLEGQGIKGKLYGPRSCPVAQYLQRAGCTVHCVDSGVVVANGDTVETPKVISRFIERFDDGRYPSLIRKGGK